MIKRSTKSLSLLLLVLPAFASLGDRSPAYAQCLSRCLPTCPTPAPSFTLYPCSSRCSYECLTHLTDLALSHPSPSSPLYASGGELHGLLPGEQVQFFGKWPFRRYFGMQEIVSVVFSVANGVMHFLGMLLLRNVKDGEGKAAGLRTLKRFYNVNALVGINTWIWSIVFHTRDTGWTERADYFAAAISTLYGLLIAVIRIAGLWKQGRGRRRMRWALAALAVLVGVTHCVYLALGDRFDYGYNMKFNLAVGVGQILLWGAWAICTNRVWRTTSTTTAKSKSGNLPKTNPNPNPNPMLPLLLLASFTALEVFDFPPIPSNWRLLDAHALWHASTIGVVGLWYKFLVADLESLRGVGEGEGRTVGILEGVDKKGRKE